MENNPQSNGIQTADVVGGIGTTGPVIATQAFDFNLWMTVIMVLLAVGSFTITLTFNLLNRRDQKKEREVRRLEAEAELNKAGVK